MISLKPFLMVNVGYCSISEVKATYVGILTSNGDEVWYWILLYVVK